MLDTTTIRWYDARDEKPEGLNGVILVIRWNGTRNRTCCAGRRAHDKWWADILGTELELGDENVVTHWAYFPDVPPDFSYDTF